MTDDPYATLGVETGADEAAIRAAYRAAMKRHHPDQNPSADAADKARAVAAAYRLLSDPEQRARLDRQRDDRAQMIVPAPPPPRRAVARGRVGGLLLVLLSAGIVALAVTKLDGPAPPSLSLPPTREVPLVDVVDRNAKPRPAGPPEAIAAEPLKPVPVAATESVVPPAELGPEHRLRVATPTSAALAQLTEKKTEAVTTSVAVVAAPLASVAKPAATPADECEMEATCARIDLAALQRMQGLLDSQSAANAPPEKQARLLSTRAIFLARLGRCTSAACKRDAYLARNREVAGLMRQ